MKPFKPLFYALIAISLFATSCTRVTPTEAGFRVSNSGDYRGVDSLPLLTGWQFYFPSQSFIVTIPTTMQHVVWSEGEEENTNPNEHIPVSCMGGSGFKVDVGLNYRVKPNSASKIYLKYKMDDMDQITNTYIRNIVRGTMTEVSGYMPVDSMLNNLPLYEKVVRERLTILLEKEGFIVDGFNIINKPRPDDPALAAAINRKITAIQDVQTEILNKQKSIAKSQQKIQTALGDSADRVIRSNAEAQAIKNLQHELTPEYIDYVRIQKWNGQVSQYQLGGGTTLLNIK